MKKSNKDILETKVDETLSDDSAIPRDFGTMYHLPNQNLVACIHDPTTEVEKPSSIWEFLIQGLIANMDDYQYSGPIRLVKTISLYSIGKPH